MPPWILPTQKQPTTTPTPCKLIQPSPILANIPSTKPQPQTLHSIRTTDKPDPSPLLCNHFKSQGFKTEGSSPLVEGESPIPTMPHQQATDPHWRSTLPSITTLQRGPFRKQDHNHSFTQEASLDTIAFIAISLGFITNHNLHNLTSAHPPLQQLQQAISSLANYDFQWIKAANPDWATQTKIHLDKPTAFLACLFHYNMDMSLIMRYLGRNYTAAHRNVNTIICHILLTAALPMHHDNRMPNCIQRRLLRKT